MEDCVENWRLCGVLKAMKRTGAVLSTGGSIAWRIEDV
jgi:hypothetical protein